MLNNNYNNSLCLLLDGKAQNNVFCLSAPSEHHHHHKVVWSNQHGYLMFDANTRAVSEGTGRRPFLTTKSFTTQTLETTAIWNNDNENDYDKATRESLTTTLLSRRLGTIVPYRESGTEEEELRNSKYLMTEKS